MAVVAYKQIEIYSGGGLVETRSSIEKYMVSSGFTVMTGEGGSARNTTIASGGSMVVRGGYVSSASVRYGGVMQLHHAASNVMLMGGILQVSSGGSAQKATVYQGGSAVVYAGGEMSGCSVRDGHVAASGGLVSEVSLLGGSVTVGSGGIARGVAQEAAETLVHVFSGGRLESLVNDGAETRLDSGAVAVDTVLNGYMVEDISGSVTSRVYAATMTLYDGAVHSGTLMIDAWSSLKASAGATIDFTVAKQTVGGAALINDWSRITDAGANYTITVKADQAAGTYALAGGAAKFDKTITVKTAESELGTITIGATLTVGNINYTLNKTDGNLSLTISEAASHPVISGKISIGNGEMIENAEVISGGYLYISSGGVANSTTVFSGGQMTIYSGGVANSTMVNSDGWMYISSGGVANSTTVNSGGQMWISSGGTANNTTMIWGGFMDISSGGVANSTTVNSGGMHI
ncbi:MAG: AIDA repeat-containing protein, partial [Lentisphaeria bacterium]|nr:AIDA repeat-containing protein [Lentisphaeria bacterium]